MGELSTAQLEAMIEQATVDAYDEHEQLAGFYAVIIDHLEVPFDTIVLGVNITVEAIDLLPNSQIVARCSRGPHRQAIGILDLPLLTPAPQGAEWIEAYRHWAP